MLDYKDLYAFILANLWIATRRLPNVKEYYSNDEDLRDNFLCRLRKINGLSGRRLQQMFVTTRMYDKEECLNTGRSVKGNDNYDPQFRCRDFLTKFSINSQKMLNPGRHLSLDESMELFTVRNYYIRPFYSVNYDTFQNA